MTELLDARGVAIAPGDTVIYGFTVGRSVAMAEAVVLGEHREMTLPGWIGECACGEVNSQGCAEKRQTVSLTESGRVRLRVVRRSYSSGEKPIVDVAPDRLVVLKNEQAGFLIGDTEAVAVLPPSPLPTQDETARAKIKQSMAHSVAALRATEAPEWWVRPSLDRYPVGPTAEAVALAEYHAFHVDKLKELRRKLRALDEG